MILLGLGIVYLLGFTVLVLFIKEDLEKKLTRSEVLGLSFLFGIGFQTVFMFLFDLAHIPITGFSLAAISLIFIVVIIWKNRKLIKTLPHYFLPKQKPDIKRINYTWLMIFLAICFLIFSSIAKNLFWPTTSYDSVAGYDLMGKVIATEGKIHVSLFDLNLVGRRGIYPPLVEGSFAFAYLWGISSSKIIISLFYISLILIFYPLLRKYVDEVNAVFFCLILIVTPEMFAHSSLSLSNLPSAVYAGLGLIYLFVWFGKREKHLFYIASILLALNLWARNDGIVFNFAGLLLLIYDSIRSKRWNEPILFFLITFSPFICWTIYLKLIIGISQDRFVDHLFWDSGRIKTIFLWVKSLLSNTNLYGLTFYLFFLAIFLNIKNVLKDKQRLLILIFLSFLFYCMIYYQFDDLKQDPLNAMMSTSFKRAMFYFVPLVLFYCSTNKMSQRIFSKIDQFRTGKQISKNI